MIIKILFTLIFILLTSADIFSQTATKDGQKIYKKNQEVKESILKGRVIEILKTKGKDGNYKKQGISNATVELKNKNLGVGYYKIKTDKDGNFEIRDFIREINYSMEITAEGFVSVTNYNVNIFGFQEITLDREAVLFGKITDSSEKPVEGVEVKVKSSEYYYSSGYHKPITLTTGKNGLYSFNKLKSGPYYITFDKPGYIKETAQIQMIKKAEKFRLGMKMIKPAIVSGNIKIKEVNVPAGNFNIVLEGRVTHTTVSFQNGDFRIDDVKPGKYKLKLSHRGFLPVTDREVEIKEGINLFDQDYLVTPVNPGVSVYADRYVFAPASQLSFNVKSIRIEKLKVRIFKVPSKTLLSPPVDINKADTTKLGFELAKEWEETVKNFEPYEWMYVGMDFKDTLPAGGYCLEVGDGYGVVDRKFFTVTTVGVVVKRSPTSVLVYAANLVTNEPLGNVKLDFYDTKPEPASKKTSRLKNKNLKLTGLFAQGEGEESIPEGEINPENYNPNYNVNTDIYRDDFVQGIKDFKLIHSGSTDAFGIYQFKLENFPKNLHVFAVTSTTDFAVTSTGQPFSPGSEQNKFFIYTDRPVYRSGDTTYFKVVAKKRDVRFLPIDKEKLYYNVYLQSDESQNISEGEMELDEWGTANFEIKLPSELTSGKYIINVDYSKENANSNGSGHFFVEQYRKPEFKIEISTNKSYYVNNESLEFKVDARYFFGAPLKDAVVNYRFYENKLPDTNTSYWWEEESGNGNYYNRVKLEGEKALNENGIAILKLDAGNFPYDREITLEATIVDKSNIAISSVKKVKIGRGEYFIKINPARSFYSINEGKEISIKSLNMLGEAVPTNLVVRVYRYIWKPWQRVYVHDERPVFESKISTDNDGNYILKLEKELMQPGEFDIVVSGYDRNENLITGSRVLWVYGFGNEKIESKFKNLEITIDKSSLEKSEEVTLLLKSRFTEPKYILITLEGRTVYESFTVKMEGNVMPVKVNIKEEYAPNLFVTATMQKSRSLFTTSQEVNILTKDTDLKIIMEADKEKYLPGEKAKLKVNVKNDEGKPVETDFSLAVVDEAIFQIRPDHTPKMNPFFYTKISNWVNTTYSYPIDILAGAGKDEGQKKIRENFKDTAFWKANLRTDASGNADVIIPLPDNLTTWRLTMRAHDKTGRVGENKSEILVTKDIISRIGKPRFFVEEDRISLIGIVNNNSPNGFEKLKTEFKANNKKLEPEEKLPLSLAKGAVSRTYHNFKVPKTDSVVLEYSAESGKENDALRQKVPTERKGTLYKIFGNGDLKENKEVQLKPISGEGKISFEAQDLQICLSPGPISKMLTANQFLTEYPYGCNEQTLNKFLPSLALQELSELKKTNAIVLPDNLEEKIRSGVNKIQERQNDDGTWGWFAGDRGNEFLTGYVIYGLMKAKNYGVDPERIKNGITAVKRILSNPQYLDPDARAYLLYILVVNNDWHQQSFDLLSKDKPKLNAYQIAYLVRAIASMKSGYEKLKPEEKKKIDDEIAKKPELKKQYDAYMKIIKELPEYVSLLKSKLKRDSKGAYFPGTYYQSYGWPGTNSEISAHGLIALLEAGDNSSVVSGLAASIGKRTTGVSWLTTKETATAIFSLTEYLKSAKGKLPEAGNVEFLLDGKKVASINYDTRKPELTKDYTVKVPLERKVKNNYSITAVGKAGPDVTFDIVLRGHVNQNNEKINKKKYPEKLQNGFQILRSYYSIKRVKDVNNSEYLVPEALDPDEKLKVGEEIMVKLQFTASDNFEYVLLEDFFASGFEVVQEDAYGKDRYKPYSALDRRDNRLVYFFSSLTKGTTYEVAYIIRTELPGEFTTRPARAECMYEPSIQGFSVPTKFIVER